MLTNLLVSVSCLIGVRTLFETGAALNLILCALSGPPQPLGASGPASHGAPPWVPPERPIGNSSENT
eukprot:1191777-Pyramimonas_sp.AAC.1